MRVRVRRWFVCVFATAVTLAACTPVLAENAGELLQMVTAGCEARCAAITTGKGEVRVREWRTKGDKEFTTELTITGAFSGERCNLSKQSVMETSGKLVEASSEISFDGTNSVEFNSALNPPARIKPGRAPCVAAFAAYYDPRSRDICRWPSWSDSINVIGEEVLNGDDCVVLRAERLIESGKENLNETTKFWVNLDKGFTVPRIEWVLAAADNVIRTRVIENQVRQYSDGLWACSKCTSISRDAEGNKIKEQVITYTPGFQINVPVTDEELQISLPPGTALFDEILGAEYIVP